MRKTVSASLTTAAALAAPLAMTAPAHADTSVDGLQPEQLINTLDASQLGGVTDTLQQVEHTLGGVVPV